MAVTARPLSSRVQSGEQREEAAIASTRLRQWRVAIVAIVVFAASFANNISDIYSTPFHPDESRWINRAYYLKELLHPLSSTWDDRYLTRGQPPFGSYVIGLGLLVQGRNLTTNGPWDFRYGDENIINWNVLHGTMPSWNDLYAARRMSCVLGALTCVIIFLLVTHMTNAVGGMFGAAFFALNPLQTYIANLGVSDATFTFLIALAALALLYLVRRPTWPRAILLGICLGAGGSTKLSPLFVAFALAAMGLVMAFSVGLRRVPLLGRILGWIPRFDEAKTVTLGWRLVSTPITALMFFYLSYPYLWPHPYGRLRDLFKFREDEMANQASIWPSVAVNNRFEALHRIWINLENIYSTSTWVIQKLPNSIATHLPDHGFDIPVALVGLAILALLAWRRGITSTTFQVTAYLVAQAAVIVGGLRVDFNRYYLPFVFVFAIGVGILFASIWQAFIWMLTRNRSANARP